MSITGGRSASAENGTPIGMGLSQSISGHAGIHLSRAPLVAATATHTIFARVVLAEDLANLLGKAPVAGCLRLLAKLLWFLLLARLLSHWFAH